MKKISTVLITLIVLALFAITGCGKGKDVSAGATPQAMPVKVQEAKLEPSPEFTEYLATLRSRRSAVIHPEVEGQVTRIFVSSGDRVAAGTPLLQIDPQKQRATVSSQQATQRSRRAAQDFNQQELERHRKLYAAGVISKQELDRATTAHQASQADVDALEASVQEQQVQLRYYTIKAPGAGTVGVIPVRVGDRVSQSTELTTLDQGGELEAYISIPAEKAGQARVGTPVELLPGGDAAPVRTKLDFVSPRVDPESQLLVLKAPVSNREGRFRHQQSVHARVIWSQEERPRIPVTAVSRMGGQAFAYVAEKSDKGTVARQRLIKLGEIIGSSYVVLEGIKPGEQIIITGAQMLTDGTPVTPES